MARERPLVLCGEDDVLFRTILRVGLQKHGYDVIVVGTGSEVRAAVLKERPDAVILDVMMPGIDGFSLLCSLRSDPKTAKLPVILCSARHRPEEIQRALREGASAYLTKPVRLAELTERLQELIGT